MMHTGGSLVSRDLCAASASRSLILRRPPGMGQGTAHSARGRLEAFEFGQAWLFGQFCTVSFDSGRQFSLLTRSGEEALTTACEDNRPMTIHLKIEH